MMYSCDFFLLRWWTGAGEASVSGYLFGQLNRSLAQHQPSYLDHRFLADSHLRICFELRSVACFQIRLLQLRILGTAKPISVELFFVF